MLLTKQNNPMKTSFMCAVVAFAAFIATTTAFAQEWTKAQKEVWQVVEDSWTKWKAGDIEGSFACFHEKYQGWGDDMPLPMTKENVLRWSQEMKNIQKLDNFSLNPARILITENAAVVDYYFWYEETYTKGDKKEIKESQGKNAEFYIREGGKWLLLGDMTIHEKKENNTKNND
jgi:ketosteroid isomerase-like protein